MSINTPAVDAPATTTTVISVVPAPRTATAHDTGPSTAVLLACAVVVALIGIALGRLTAPRPATHVTPSSPRPPEPIRGSTGAGLRPTTQGDLMVTDARSDVDRLALCCLQIADAVSSPALRRDIDQALREVGYELVDPTGQRFDPGRHDAVERRSTPDAAAHNVVAATYRPGCSGHGRLLRTPEVAVFRFDAGR